MTILVPLRTINPLNRREHHYARAKRVKNERLSTSIWLTGIYGTRTKPATPCGVTLTRIAPSNGLDDDGLTAALKGVRDEIAKWLGVDDKHRDIVRYSYEQERGPWGVRIEFGPMPVKPTGE